MIPSFDPHPQSSALSPQSSWIGFLLPWLILASGCAHVPPNQTAERPFDFKRDSFSFANETIWHYENGAHVANRDEPVGNPGPAEAGRYTQRCFVMARAAVQFWKFARFEPKQPALAPEELTERIRSVTRREVWREPLSQENRIVFPGFSNLRQMSRQETALFQKNIGLGWPTYFRPGNFCMIETPSRAHQMRTNIELQTWLKQGHPMIVWLYNFPKMDINHAVVVHARQPPQDRAVYTVYDPNYSDRSTKLEFDSVSQMFIYQKTFYFQGGAVSARPVYLSALQ